MTRKSGYQTHVHPDPGWKWKKQVSKKNPVMPSMILNIDKQYVTFCGVVCCKCLNAEVLSRCTAGVAHWKERRVSQKTDLLVLETDVGMINTLEPTYNLSKCCARCRIIAATTASNASNGTLLLSISIWAAMPSSPFPSVLSSIVFTIEYEY